MMKDLKKPTMSRLLSYETTTEDDFALCAALAIPAVISERS